jgi:glutamine---fructose-6-phosphate transaminase (isomerizing)
LRFGREADAVLHTLAGPEIGVASTKAFTTQLVVLPALSIAAASARGTIDAKREQALVEALLQVPGLVTEVLEHDTRLKAIALKIAEARDVLFLGRGTSYPIALEGALKLKEISYIHAEGYAAGEMKHGPIALIALIDDGVPIIVVAPSDTLFDKTASNLHEMLARGGQVIFLSDVDGIRRLGAAATAVIAPKS